MRKCYRNWLERQEYSPNTISTQYSHASRVEQAYGDLDSQYETDHLEGVLSSLRYSTADGRRRAANPSKLTISGDLYKGLASFRSAVGLYRRFRDETINEDTSALTEVVSVPSSARQKSVDANGERIGLERDLQMALRREIEQLEAGLTIIDEGIERAVESGYIDITARDASGAIVIVELKAGTADRGAIGQILSYMGDIADEEEAADVRGILVAHDFDAKARAAARMVPNLTLRKYAVKFAFLDALS